MCADLFIGTQLANTLERNQVTVLLTTVMHISFSNTRNEIQVELYSHLSKLELVVNNRYHNDKTTPAPATTSTTRTQRQQKHQQHEHNGSNNINNTNTTAATISTTRTQQQQQHHQHEHNSSNNKIVPSWEFVSALRKHAIIVQVFVVACECM